mmetsp:Transcript_9843/g.16223  ORF Transcript_9843/g.16223 Transcript_9843/m.16223 type:complete len:403 (+) Transcript_9843:80-1288(+)
MALENKLDQIFKLDSKEQSARIVSISDEIVASGSLPGLKTLSQKLLSEDTNPQVARSSLVHLATSVKSLPGEVFYDIGCFLLTCMKQHPSSFDEADYILRDALFDYNIGCEDYVEAAQTLAGVNLESTTRVFSAQEKVDIYIKCAEAVLEADEAIDAEIYVNKASALVNSVDDWAIQLRFRVTYARVMDANRKFLEAAIRYSELSSTTNTNVVQDDLLELLGKAVTCAILGKTGQQRSRVLGLLVKDDRLSSLDHNPKYSSHSNVLTKMYKEQLIKKSELDVFQASLMPHQQATASDGYTILEKAVMEHNMMAMGKIYDNITFEEAAKLLSMAPEQAEKVAGAMITEGRLAASIDQTEDLLIFEGQNDSSTGWDQGIERVCKEISDFADSIPQKQQQQKLMT